MTVCSYGQEDRQSAQAPAVQPLALIHRFSCRIRRKRWLQAPTVHDNSCNGLARRKLCRKIRARPELQNKVGNSYHFPRLWDGSSALSESLPPNRGEDAPRYSFGSSERNRSVFRI